MSIHASVIVPTYKRSKLLARCLHALVGQDYPRDAYEIIVVDDAGAEETRSLVSSFERRMTRSDGQCMPAIRYIPAIHTQGPAAARNVGWQNARGEIIAFTDDDCLPQLDWLRHGAAALEGGVVGASGCIEVPLGGDPTDYERDVAGLVHSTFATANCFYLAGALERTGGFDERFTAAWRGDADLFFGMLEHSFELVDAPDAVVIHPARPAAWGVSLFQQRKAMYNALLYKKHPALYRSLIQSLPPLRYYALLVCAASFWAAILFQNDWAAHLMAVLWLGLTLQFAFQRLLCTRKTASHILEMLVTSILIPPLAIFWRLAGALRYRVLFL